MEKIKSLKNSTLWVVLVISSAMLLSGQAYELIVPLVDQERAVRLALGSAVIALLPAACVLADRQELKNRRASR